MPLDSPGLEADLESLFAAPPATSALCAQAWADAVEGYSSGIVPASTTVTASAAALATALGSAFTGSDKTATAAAMESAFATFAASVGAGMAGYTPTPPPGSLGFAALMEEPFPETHADAATVWADAIHAWMTTGIGTLIAPPNTVVPWS